jgi:hypothetical protein
MLRAVVASARIEVIVPTAGMDSVALRRIRRICLDPAASEERQREQGQREAEREKKPQVRKRLAAAPP